VQQLLCRDEPGTVAVAASVLEAGIAYSPYNAHLKIAAIRVYSDLNAATRSYELFQSIFVKHIQYESCAYLILPVLRFGGMYREIICVCKELIRLQRIAVHDATDFAGRAMENGALSKADEFLRFQRERMNCSLTTLEAKGLILDAAPMLSTHKDSDSSLGSVHGIVGCELDFDRATQMIGEANDPLGAFSLLTLRRQDSDLTQQYSENRDFSVLYLEMLSRRQCASAEDIVCDSLYRSYTHNLLLRSTLCLKAAKGPKKGRVVPATDEIRQRCTSLLVLIDTALRDCIDSPEGVKGQHQLFTALIGLCRVLSGVSSGLFSDASDTDGDSLEMREEKATLVLSDVRTCFLQAKNGMVLLNESSTHLISRLLSENLISLFAVFRMCADTLDAFGWGKRKRRASHCASAMADVAYAFGDLINNMVLALSRYVARLDFLSAAQLMSRLTLTSCLRCSFSLSVSTVSTGELSSKIVPDIIEDALYAGTLSVISESRRSTHNRLTRILLVIKASLEEFDVRE
jgi:N-terminal acetyltransferase B complex non-catalytic subunit